MAAHLLIVEDEEKLARFVELELQHEGYEVSKAADGREGQGGIAMIDFDRLRRDLADDRYAGAFAGMPAMIIGAWEVESASEEELLELADREGIDLDRYEL